MHKGFWEQLKKPIMALAPLHDVTDTVFRQMIALHAKPDVMFTEFVSTDGLAHTESRERMIWRYLRFDEVERPLVVQLWGTNPDYFYQAAMLVQELGFDGIDLNFGCPEKSATKHGACAAMIETPKKAQALIRATKKGAGMLPVSVKTRLGYSKDVSFEWTKMLLETEPAVLTMHGRIAKHMSKYPADWEAIGHVAELVRKTDTLMIGNGDVRDLEEGHEKAKTYGLDGVMFGRAIFSNHWLFDRSRTALPSVREKLDALIAHARLYEETFGTQRNFSVLYKHVKAYTARVTGAKDMRRFLMRARSAREIQRIIEDWLCAHMGL